MEITAFWAATASDDLVLETLRHLEPLGVAVLLIWVLLLGVLVVHIQHRLSYVQEKIEVLLANKPESSGSSDPLE